jgi:hypothetical protein
MAAALSAGDTAQATVLSQRILELRRKGKPDDPGMLTDASS